MYRHQDFFQLNESPRFDGLNLFCYLSAQCVIAINAGEGSSRLGVLSGLPPSLQLICFMRNWWRVLFLVVLFLREVGQSELTATNAPVGHSVH